MDRVALMYTYVSKSGRLVSTVSDTSVVQDTMDTSTGYHQCCGCQNMLKMRERHYMSCMIVIWCFSWPLRWYLPFDTKPAGILGIRYQVPGTRAASSSQKCA